MKIIEIIKDNWNYLENIIIYLLGIISKSLWNFLKNKYYNKKIIKENINEIKYVCKNLFSKDTINLFKYIINNEKYKFDTIGICTFAYSDNYEENDKEFNKLVDIANKDNNDKCFYINDETPLFFIKEKSQNECIIYIHPILIQMIKNNEI